MSLFDPQKVPWWLGGGAALLGGLAAWALGRRPVSYERSPEGYYGPAWGDERPPGLPAGVRPAGSKGSAEPAVRRAAKRHINDPVFIDAVVRLAYNESGARFALPANTFDARCPQGYSPDEQRLCTTVDGPRPSGKQLITAWGVFNFNRDAWRHVKGSWTFPWEASAREEVELPIVKYAELYRAVLHTSGSQSAAARGVHLWHRSPVAFSKFLDDLREPEATAYSAWQQVPTEHRDVVDRHLA